MRGRSWLGIVSLGVVIALAAYLGTVRSRPGPSVQSGEVQDGPATAARARAFSLTDSNGMAVTDQSFRGHWLIVFFGFTHCADICPVALFNLSTALGSLGEQGAQVQVAFVTIDPERDSPEALKAYLQPFGPRFIGLTGSQDAISAAERTFRAYAERLTATADGNYQMKHSSSFYVLDPAGQFRRQISAESTIPGLAASLRSAMASNPG